jgi:phage regulator Rha-like protein
MPNIVPIELIENKIYIIRGHKVMIDSDLANLYNVETRILNRDVKRNIERFPEDFMFQLTDNEWEILISQIGISMESKGGRRYNPYVFTEYGVLMLSNVLNSKRAIAVSIQIVRVFAKLKEIALTNKELAQRIDELESKFINHAKETRIDIDDIFRQLKQLSEITKPSQDNNIGFQLK